MGKHKMYTKIRTKQRADTALTLNIANALFNSIMEGKNLYSSGDIVLTLPDSQDSTKTLKISRGTLNSWITRRNIVPETGETLHDVLVRAKEQYRVNNLENRKKKIIEEAEKKLFRVMNLRTNQPVRNMIGQTMKREDGSLVRKENVPLLRTQLDAAKFVLERLNPKVYGKSPDSVVVNKFSLADLRKAKEKDRLAKTNK